jgi:hypothetical protein
MMEHCEKGAATHLARDAETLFNPIGKPLCSKDQLDSFVRLKHEQMRERLIGAEGPTKAAMERMWIEAKVKDDALKKIYGSKVTTAMKLMCCWAKEACKQGRITKEQLAKIIDALPAATMLPLPNAPTNPESPSTDADGKIQQVAVRDDHTAQSAAVPIVVEEDEEWEDATKDNRHALVDVMCHESVFYTKTSNIERQLEGSVFNRTKKLFKHHAKDSKAMIDKAVKLQSTFGPHWQVCQ